MGFPVTEAARQAYKGVSCQFSRGCDFPVNPNRTRRSQVCQLGNSMHVTSMGSVVFATVWQQGWLLAAQLPEHAHNVFFAATSIPRAPLAITTSDAESSSDKLVERARAFRALKAASKPSKPPAGPYSRWRA